jgi:hypothetical protein
MLDQRTKRDDDSTKSQRALGRRQFSNISVGRDLLADFAVAVLCAPGVAVAVGIPKMPPVLAALLVGVCDWNADHLAIDVGEHHGLVRPDALAASQ